MHSSKVHFEYRKTAVHFKASVDRGRSGLESSWWAAHGNLINVDTLYIGSSYKPPATTVAFSMFFLLTK